ncbi:MAG: prephenate dehydratase [Firmicutes bacterium]|nr:prephenate dehydratase [Bacillota bacterium]
MGDGQGAKIGFLGPRGTFSEEAARKHLAQAGLDAELIPYRGIPDLLAAVERAELDWAVVPAENSIEGSVAVTLDTLAHDVDVAIAGEIVLAVRHHLLVRRGHEGWPIHTVVSHPQALAQCRRYLQARLPGVSVQAAFSTAEAARLAGESEEPGLAAIGNSLCADLYGLAVLDSDIQDFPGNATRFFVAGRADRPRTGQDKTSVVFAFAADRPGNLYRALGEFARRNINLTKLESRPAKQLLGDYIFFADLEGHRADPAVAGALEGLRRQCAYVKVLGSYPRADYAGVRSRTRPAPAERQDNR